MASRAERVTLARAIVSCLPSVAHDALVGLMLVAVCPEIELRGVVMTGPESARRARGLA
jgi:hypothetical protein